MPDEPKRSWTLSRIAIASFALVTAALLLPGYFTSMSAKPPEDADFYVKQAFERRTRVFHDDGHFGRLTSEARFGKVISFQCQSSAKARREFGWRGAREVLFDCPSGFEDNKGRKYVWVFRLIPDTDISADPSPEGYRTMHIDAEDAFVLLTDQGLMP